MIVCILAVPLCSTYTKCANIFQHHLNNCDSTPSSHRSYEVPSKKMSRDDGYDNCSGTRFRSIYCSCFYLLLLPSNFKPTNLVVGWNGLVFDADRGLGLAMWKSEESYIDVQHIINKVGEDTFTALHNPGLNDCRDGDCDEKLVRLLHK